MKKKIRNQEYLVDKYRTLIGDKTSFKNESLLNIKLMNRRFTLELELKTIEIIRKKLS